MEVENFLSDDGICTAGDPSNRLYIIMSGEVDIFINQEIVNTLKATYKDGEKEYDNGGKKVSYFGERGFVNKGFLSALSFWGLLFTEEITEDLSSLFCL